MAEWTRQQGRETYNIGFWSGGYFDIGPGGRLVARLGETDIDLYQLAHEVRASGLSLPVLVRFVDILRDRVGKLCDAFDLARQSHGYQGRYTAVYPVKVNQQSGVVMEIVRAGGGRVGLEAGSRPELMAVLALASEHDNVVICNGYKDREFIRLALIGRRMGIPVHIVIEKQSELRLVLEESARMGIAPWLGLRVRLASIGAGNWQNTGGEKSKFGLSAGQVLDAVETLKAKNLLDNLVLLHCHMGSQIANIRDIQTGMKECARFFAELYRLGAPIRSVDVGGGLGIDYEGTRSRNFCSMNYTLEEYANKVVHALWEVCQEKGIPEPDIITESGRALTAHHAVLITEVIDHETLSVGDAVPRPAEDEPLILQDLAATLASLQRSDGPSATEAYHDATYWLAEARSMYTHGLITLEQRAAAETIYHAICEKVRDRLSNNIRHHRQLLDELDTRLVDKYFCNFSVFQSIPDVWAIEQIFPIVPLHRLDEPPTRCAVLEDLTCDSDGRIDHYVDGNGIGASLRVHPLREGEPYLLGVFLVGAYQEILGDIHNLFGDTDSVNVVVDGRGGFHLSEPKRGDTVASVLGYVDFDPNQLVRLLRSKMEKADLPAGEKSQFLRELEAGLQGYTYLE